MFNIKFFTIALILTSYTQITFSQNVIWEEIFDSTNIVSRGWTITNNDSSAKFPELYRPFEFYNLGLQNSHKGKHFFKFNFEDANSRGLIDDWIITPKFSGIESGDSISFWCGAIDRMYKDSLKIWISTSDSNTGSFRMIDYFKVNGPVGSWYKKSYDLSAYAGKNIYFAVNYYISNGGALGIASDNVWIDHFTLTGRRGVSEITTYVLDQNFPNPFNPGTEIIFSIPNSSNVTLKVYDALGKEVAVLVNGFFNKGRFRISFDGTNFSSGVYFYKLNAGNFTDTKKMELIK